MNWTIVAHVTRNGAWKGEFLIQKAPEMDS